MRWYGRLRRHGDIVFVRRRGRHAACETLTAYAAPAASGNTLVAVTVSKAVGNAVVRNLVRRRICGALDALGQRPHNALRFVFIARPAAATVPFSKIEADVRAVVLRCSA